MDKGNIKILFIGLLFLISLSVIVFSDTTLNTYIPGTSWNQNVTGQWLNRTGILGNIMGSNILANVTKGGVCGNYTFFINVSQESATTHINLSSINISLPTVWTYNGNNYTVNYTQSPSALTTVPVDLTNFNCTGVNATGVVSGININQIVCSNLTKTGQPDYVPGLNGTVIVQATLCANSPGTEIPHAAGFSIRLIRSSGGVMNVTYLNYTVDDLAPRFEIFGGDSVNDSLLNGTGFNYSNGETLGQPNMIWLNITLNDLTIWNSTSTAELTIDLWNSTTWGNQSFASVNTTNKSRFYGMGKHVSINWTQQIVNFVSNTTYYMNLSLTDSVNNTNSSIMYVFFVGNITIRNGTTDSYKNASIIRGDDDGLLFNATPYTNRWNNCSLYADFNGNYVVNQTITPGYLDERVNPMLTFNKINVSDNSTGYKYEINCTDVIGGQAIMLDTRELGVSTHQKRIIVDNVKPTATITSSAGTTLALGQDTTLTCSIGDLHPRSASMSVNAGTGGSCSVTTTGETTGTGCSASYIASQAGAFTVTCTGEDNVSRSTTTTLTLSVSDTGSGSSSSSGGGSGGAGASVAATTDAVANTPTEVLISNEDVGVESIIFTTTEGVSDVKFTLTQYTVQPAETGSVSPEGDVYKYFEVDSDKLTDENLANAEITFKVENTWMQENGYGISDIVLMRYDNDWQELETNYLNADSEYTTFKATTPGFSYFAVTAKTSVEVPSEEEISITEELPTAEPTEIIEETTKGKWLLTIIILLILVAVGFAIYYFKKKK